MFASNKFRLTFLAVVLLGILGVAISIINDMRLAANRVADADAARITLETAKVSIEGVFAEPSELFEQLVEGSALDVFRVASSSPIDQVAMSEEITTSLRTARAKYPNIRGLYVADQDGTIIAADGDGHDGDLEPIRDIVARALVLQEGEVAISRTQRLQKDASILYATPIECTGCIGQPQIGAVVAVVGLDAFFKKVAATAQGLPTLFVVNAEGRYLFNLSAPEKVDAFVQGGASTFAADFPDDYANIIELRGTHSFQSHDEKHTYFVETLYPGLDGRVNGIPRKLNVRYVPTEQQFWVIGFYK